MSKRTKSILYRCLIYMLLILFSILIILPFAWMVSSSLKSSKDVFSFPIQWVPAEPVWENYQIIWEKIPLLTFFLNTSKLTVIITFLQVITSTLAAYAFAKIEFTGRNVLFLGYVSTIAIPWQVYMIPQFIIVRKLGLVDTHLSLILLQAFTAFGVFLVRQYYLGIPKELSEAARIDGASEFGIYRKIMLPIAKPAIATLIIFTFVSVWNDYMGPLIYLNTTSKKTIQLGLKMFIGLYNADYNLMMAASLCSLIPVMVMFLFMQRYFIEGIAAGSVKG